MRLRDACSAPDDEHRALDVFTRLRCRQCKRILALSPLHEDERWLPPMDDLVEVFAHRGLWKVRWTWGLALAVFHHTMMLCAGITTLAPWIGTPLALVIFGITSILLVVISYTQLPVYRCGYCHPWNLFRDTRR